MTTPHKATPEQWKDAEELLSTLPNPSTISCLLELRDRIASLEAAANRQAILDTSPAPAGGLVERVNKALGAASGLPSGNWTHCADAAILAVAEWLNKKAEAHLGGGAYWSRQLRKEVERHG